MGFSPFGMDLLLDGINEKGLACGGFFLPGYAQYQNEDPSGRIPSLSCLDLVSWVLGTCATVEEVRRRLPELRVVGAPLAAWNAVPPLHYFVADPTGDVLVVEYLEGNLVLHDGSVGVITNSPDYRWHLTNLRNYIGLRPPQRRLREPSGGHPVPVRPGGPGQWGSRGTSPLPPGSSGRSF